MLQVSHFVDTRFNCHWTTPATHQQPLLLDSTHQSALSVPLYWRNDGSWPHWHLGRLWHHAVWRGCSQSHAHPTCHHVEHSPHDSGCVSGNESLPQVPAKREMCRTEMTYWAYICVSIHLLCVYWTMYQCLKATIYNPLAHQATKLNHKQTTQKKLLFFFTSLSFGLNVW